MVAGFIVALIDRERLPCTSLRTNVHAAESRAIRSVNTQLLSRSRDSPTAPGPVRYARSAMRGGIYVLNFYSTVFVDQLKRGRKTATIRLGDKTSKYERGQVVWITVGFRHSPREKIFAAVIDDVEVKNVGDLSPRDIEHDNPEFRRLEDEVKFLEQIYGRTVGPDDLVTVIRFSQIVEPPGAHFGNGETPHHN
jgi:hypothetical protein